jgi:hypothetical protein
MKSCRFIAIVALAVINWPSNQARGQFEELAARVPDTANALALFNVDKIAAGDQALRADLKQEYEESFRAGRVLLPPGASRCIAAAQLDFGSMQPLWELTLVDYKQEPNLSLIARQHGGQIESISGAPSISILADLYLVQLGPKRLASLSPVGRQEVSRWLKRTASKKDMTLSPYLEQALHYSQQEADIILAIDLEDAVDPARIRQSLTDSPTLRSRRLDADRVAEVLTQIQGLMLGIRSGKETRGKLRVDFRSDASLLGDAAKPLLLELLSKTGAMIADFKDWTAVVEKQRITLEGVLSPSGLRRVTSLVEPQSYAMNAAKPAGDASAAVPAKPAPVKTAEEKRGEKVANTSEQAHASKQYFGSIQALLDDLNADVKSAVTIGQAGVWMQKYAKRVDRLPVLNVDPDALNYGAYISQQLLAASSAVKGIGIESGKRRSAVWDSGYNYYDQFVAAPARRQVNAEARAAGATSATDIMQEIYKASGDVRRTLSQRYMLEF